MENIDILLERVNTICKEYDKIVKITGENFNIFQILNLENKELSHSKIIAELLDPNGSHGKRNEFLKLFLKAINEDIEEFENASVKTEKAMEDGRMDIFIAGNQKTIAIENKIYAGEQDKQIARYSKYATKIVYLTLEGKGPSEYSTNGEENVKDKLIPISYKDIINWLEQCMEKSVNFSYLRETIAQYINLLKYLTGQSRRKDMSKNVVDAVVKSPENVLSAFEIDANWNEIKKKIVLERFVPLMKELAEKHGLIFDYTRENDCLKKWWNVSFWNDLLQKNQIHIVFQFEWNDLKDMAYGFAFFVKDVAEAKNLFSAENPLRNHIKAKAKDIAPWWPFFDKIYFKWGRNNFSGEELSDLVSEKSEVIEECEKKIVGLLELIKDYNS